MAIASEQLTGADIAFFNKYLFVAGQSENLLLSLEFAGHSVQTFDGISGQKFREATENADVLVMPSLEYYGKFPSESVKYIIRKFVHDGGTLVINSNEIYSEDTDFINDVFNTDIRELANADTSQNSRTNSATGTTFGDDPDSLDDNEYTAAWLASSLPAGAITLYSNGIGGSTVAAFQHGRGQVVLLGWDFYQAIPNGTKDGGWLDVLNSAISLTDGLPTGAVIAGGDGDDVVSTVESITGQPNASERDDIIALSGGNDRADGAAGDDWITGGLGRDRLTGGDGDDALSGGEEKDTLRGGEGVDDFLFDVKLKKGVLDKLSDFESGVDHLVLSRSIFKKLPEGILSNKQFDKYFDVKKGKVIYDSGRVDYVFAKIGKNEGLDPDHDIIVIA